MYRDADTLVLFERSLLRLVLTVQVVEEMGDRIIDKTSAPLWVAQRLREKRD